MGWEKVLSLQYQNWDDDEDKALTQRENNFLEWLYKVKKWGRKRVEWVERNEDLNYVVSDKDKAVIEALLNDDEFLTSIEVKHGSFKRWNVIACLCPSVAFRAKVIACW